MDFHKLNHSKFNDNAIIKKDIEGFFFEHIYYFILAYILPILSAISLFNNVTVIGIFLKNRKVFQSITRTMRIYYIAIAISDINDTFAIHITSILGMRSLIYLPFNPLRPANNLGTQQITTRQNILVVLHENI